MTRLEDSPVDDMREPTTLEFVAVVFSVFDCCIDSCVESECLI